MEHLLDSLDEAVFTPELKVQISELFESKVSAIKEEYDAKAEALQTSIKEEYEAKANEYAEYVKESYGAKAEEYAEYVKSELENTLSAYVDRVVEEYVEENRITIEESVENAKLRALLEGFDSMLKTGSIYLSDIVESKGDSKVAKEIEDMKSQLSDLVKENAELKAEKANLVKESIFAEVCEGLTIVEKTKLEKLSKYVKFNESDADEYRNSLIQFKEEVAEKVEESKKEDDALVESVKTEDAQGKPWSRFV
jgi:hypothetical protein